MKSKLDIQLEIENKLVERFNALEIKPLSKRGGQEEAAFLAGACVALQAVFPPEDPGKLTDYVPPMWIIGPMSGRSIYVEARKRWSAEYEAKQRAAAEASGTKPVVRPTTLNGTHRMGTLHPVTKQSIIKAIGFPPNAADDGDKVTVSWEFTVDGVECAVWDYRGSLESMAQVSFWGPAEALRKVFGDIVHPE